MQERPSCLGIVLRCRLIPATTPFIVRHQEDADSNSAIIATITPGAPYKIHAQAGGYRNSLP
jgi:hypothetical protein